MKLLDYLINAALIAAVVAALGWWYSSKIKEELLKGIQADLTKLENRLGEKNRQDIAALEKKSVDRIFGWRNAQEKMFAKHAPLVRAACQSPTATLQKCIAATNARDQELHQLSPSTVIAER